jgi:large subunit ribosomal protein L5
MESVKEKIKKSEKTLQVSLGKKNAMALPKLVKVVVASGTGKSRDKKRNELVVDRLTKITGQKPSPRAAKKSIASFKLRQGEIVGHVITLRGDRMYGFLDKFINVAVPRTRDFRGIPSDNVDEMGNLSIGVKEHTVFPETADEDLRDVFGFQITLVTTAKNKKDATEFFKAIGVPFKK